MTLAALRDSGFTATGNESVDPVTEVLSAYRIFVPRDQADEARAHLETLL